MRRWLVVVATLAAAGAAAALWTLPPRSETLEAPGWTPPLTPVAGAYHIHTVLSDGSGTIDEVAKAAARDGLRFVIITDHGDGTAILPPAYHAGVLCIDAVEISTSGGHYVALGLARPPYPLGGEPRDVVADVARLGGFGIVAHPYSLKPELRWDSWNLPFNGIEWMNADSERRTRTPWQAMADFAHYFLRPTATLASAFRRPANNLTRWDALTRSRPVVALAGADAHARIGLGGTERQGGLTLARIPSYQSSFAAFSIRAELAHPLTGDAVLDARAILEAIEEGHVYTAVDGLAHPAVFAFTGRSGAHPANEGDDLIIDGPVTLRARVNDSRARLVLFRNGERLADRTGGDAAFAVPATPGVFRVEVWRDRPGDPPMPWIVSNPIYVLAAPRTTPLPAPPAVVTAVEPFDVIGGADWRTETDPRSTLRLSTGPPLRAGGNATQQMDFTLGSGARRGQYVAAVCTTPPDLNGFDRLALEAEADRPMRVSVQIRDATGARWLRSVYVATVAEPIVVPFAELRRVGIAPVAPALATARTVLFVVDLTNADPGARGRLLLSDLRIER